MKGSVTGSLASEKPLQSFIGCDAHRRYSVFVSVDENGKASKPTRVEHEGTALQEYPANLPAGVDIAAEATGSWYWLVDAIEDAGKTPHLAEAFAARRMLGGGNKTDRLNARASGYVATQRHPSGGLDPGSATAGRAAWCVRV